MPELPIDRLRELNTKDCLWVYILRILSDGPTHAYALRKEIHDRFGFRPGTMTAYKVLYLLNRGGFVSKRKEGRKQLYTLTSSGSKELKKAISFYKSTAKMLS